MMRPFAGFLTLLLLIGLQGCASFNPVARAETAEQKAYALYGTFVIFEERAASIIAGGQIPNGVIVRIADADARAKPVADELLNSLQTVVEIRNEFQAGGVSTEARLNTALTGLNSWIERAAPVINNLVSAVEGAD